MIHKILNNRGILSIIKRSSTPSISRVDFCSLLYQVSDDIDVTSSSGKVKRCTFVVVSSIDIETLDMKS
jgi:hypothetical protein